MRKRRFTDKQIVAMLREAERTSVASKAEPMPRPIHEKRAAFRDEHHLAAMPSQSLPLRWK